MRLPTQPETRQKTGTYGQILTWLHLSDFHFRAETHWQQEVVLESLMRDVIKELPKQGLTPDMVFLSGDIAWSGKDAEYKTARSFFDQLAELSSLHW